MISLHVLVLCVSMLFHSFLMVDAARGHYDVPLSSLQNAVRGVLTLDSEESPLSIEDCSDCPAES